MRGKAFDSTLFNRPVCVWNPPYVGRILHTGAEKAFVYCKHLRGGKVLLETIQSA